MVRLVGRLIPASLLLILTAGSGLAALQAVSRRDADRLAQKIDLIVERGLVPRRTPLKTTVTEAEINSYLAVYAKGDLPPGVVNPQLTILGSDRVSAHAIVDLDAVRRSSSGGWLDPTSYLAGRVPISAEGVLRSGGGVARFQLGSAQVAGVTIPKALLQQIVSHYSRIPGYPHGISLDDPFPLPAGIRQIEMRRGEAVVVQQ